MNLPSPPHAWTDEARPTAVRSVEPTSIGSDSRVGNSSKNEMKVGRNNELREAGRGRYRGRILNNAWPFYLSYERGLPRTLFNGVVQRSD